MKTKTHSLDKIAKKKYRRYGIAVNEDRSVPCDIDGLKPVSRRALWAVYEQRIWSNSAPIKSARVVGDVMGKYHPHGDKSIYDSYVTLVNSPMKLIDGHGNWGSLSDASFAAMRYTDLRMSKYTEEVFFNKFYLPATQMVNNYDDSEKEPLILPALLPNLLLNGNFGIGVGVSTTIPSYTLKSIVKLIKRLIASGKPCTSKMCMGLEFTTLYEAEYSITENDLVNFYNTGKGRVIFKSVYELNKIKREMQITKFAPFPSLEVAIGRALALEDVINANDVSDKNDKHGTVLVRLKSNVDVLNVKAVSDEVIKKAFSAAVSYNINITKRRVGKDPNESKAELFKSNVPDILNAWVAFRLKLEKDATKYWIEQTDKDIARLELMLLAVKHRKFIILALDKKIDESALAELVANHLKITTDQANEILDLKVRKLRALEGEALNKQIKEKEGSRKELVQRNKNPESYIPDQIDELLKALSK